MTNDKIEQKRKKYTLRWSNWVHGDRVKKRTQGNLLSLAGDRIQKTKWNISMSIHWEYVSQFWRWHKTIQTHNRFAREWEEIRELWIKTMAVSTNLMLFFWNHCRYNINFPMIVWMQWVYTHENIYGDNETYCFKVNENNFQLVDLNLGFCWKRIFHLLFWRVCKI